MLSKVRFNLALKPYIPSMKKKKLSYNPGMEGLARVTRFGALLSFGILLGISTAAASDPLFNAGGSRGIFECAEDTCQTCSPGCPLEPGEWLGDVLSRVQVTRCVEYDQVPPSHCATMWKNDVEVVIYNPGKIVLYTCYQTECAYGTATSTICSNPWVRPGIQEEDP